MVDSMVLGLEMNTLTEGVTALISGMGTVFIILLLISLVISGFRFLPFSPKTQAKTEASPRSKLNQAPQARQLLKEQVEKDEAQKQSQPAAMQSLKPVAEIIHSEQSDQSEAELVAIMLAAISAMECQSPDQLVIRSYKRIN